MQNCLHEGMGMNKPFEFFKPEDFLWISPEMRSSISNKANKKLNEWLENSPTVWGQEHGIGMNSSMWNLNGPDFEREKHTHTAKLVCIEKIIIPCNEHWPIGSADPYKCICQKCGVELKQIWVPK